MNLNFPFSYIVFNLLVCFCNGSAKSMSPSALELRSRAESGAMFQLIPSRTVATLLLAAGEWRKRSY